MQSRTYASLRVSRVLICLLLILGAASLHAQTFRGGLNGTVSDQSGAVVPGAAVTATNNATGVSLNAITSSGGEFLFQDLPLGTYTITVTASGFKPEKVDSIPVTAGSFTPCRSKLNVASTGETVEVMANALALDTTSTTQTAGVGGKSLQDTPLNGRDFTQLITLAPGFSNSGAGGYGSLNGTRANQINWQIDGIDNNDLWHNIPAVNQGGVSGIAGIILPIDAVEQFSAQTQAAPESGRNPGGSVNLSLKSGTNQIHGPPITTIATSSLAPSIPLLRRSSKRSGTTISGSPPAARSSKTSCSGSLLLRSNGSLSGFLINRHNRRKPGRRCQGDAG
jgi:hypothetical protein